MGLPYVSQYLLVIVKTDHQFETAKFFGYAVCTVHVYTTTLVHAVNLAKNCNHDSIGVEVLRLR